MLEGVFAIGDIFLFHQAYKGFDYCGMEQFRIKLG